MRALPAQVFSLQKTDFEAFWALAKEPYEYLLGPCGAQGQEMLQMSLLRAFWGRLAGNALNEPSEGLLGPSESLLVTFDAKAKEVCHVSQRSKPKKVIPTR